MIYEFVMGIFMGLILGFAYLVFITSKKLKNEKELQIHVSRAANTVNKIESNLSIELVESVFLVYNEKNGTFICQGSTHEEVATNLLQSKITQAVLLDKNTTKPRFYIFIDGKLELAKGV